MSEAETITAFDADGSLNSDFQQQFMKKYPHLTRQL